MIASNAVPGFTPSTNGLRFANRFAPGPTVRFGPIDPRLIGIGDAAGGLCGGMGWFVRERFEAGLAMPSDDVAPANGSTPVPDDRSSPGAVPRLAGDADPVLVDGRVRGRPGRPPDP